ncbi:MAG: class II aldolase/adducin family protein [Streptosporangiales bacterium]|nr:class II aldolase/adducin family protein [Streptosporangiales bacterium]
MLLPEERAQLVRFARRMEADRLAVGTSGNLSVRSGNLVACTPSGVDYADLAPETICVYRLDGGPAEAGPVPTSELPMHLEVYRHTDARAIVHTHPTAATVLSTLVDELPPIHYLLALFGGPVRVARYATYGSEELAANVVAALGGRTACILANHGALSVGDTLHTAYSRARYLEWLCQVYLQARMIGEPRLLPAEEIRRVEGKLAMYGQTDSRQGDERRRSG